MLEKVADIIARALKPKLHNPSPTTMIGGQTGPGQYSYKRANPAPPILVKANRIPAKPAITPTPTAQPTPQPQKPGGKPFDDIIGKYWGDVLGDADRILAGENSRREVGPHMDIANRINPETGKWDNNAPIMKRKNPITGQMIDSIDRGLWRINNITFHDYMKRYPKQMEQLGIKGWDDMLDPELNTRFARFIYDTQGIKAWYGAK